MYQRIEWLKGNPDGLEFKMERQTERQVILKARDEYAYWPYRLRMVPTSKVDTLEARLRVLRFRQCAYLRMALGLWFPGNVAMYWRGEMSEELLIKTRLMEDQVRVNFLLGTFDEKTQEFTPREMLSVEERLLAEKIWLKQELTPREQERLGEENLRKRKLSLKKDLRINAVLVRVVGTINGEEGEYLGFPLLGEPKVLFAQQGFVTYMVMALTEEPTWPAELMTADGHRYEDEQQRKEVIKRELRAAIVEYYFQEEG